jgi:hypothetical protein
MFVTLLGGLPRPPLPDEAAPEAVLDALLEAQARHGLAPLTDGGRPPVPGDPVASWQATAARTDALVKAVVDGPRTTGRLGTEVRETVARLADAGCAWIEIAEPAAATIGADPAARARFVDDHVALTEGLDGVHLSLAITGGDASAAGIETVLAGAYGSLAVDLIDGPDQWYLVAATPATVGIICGALSARAGSDDTVELLLWATAYAASTAARGPERVGLATAGPLTDLTWAAAEAKLETLGRALELGSLPPEEQRRRLDPRALDLRSAALGRYVPPDVNDRRAP